ncbi:ferric reductase like transmembrane component-domain-containing protein [Truncatella angustata]|uniref:Ferric reductase like transmembrane component-domain-containing protein n=1 Tax=Truncatella angustata TaxID=152316 RepID=A0A9P9A3V9_9PEZI|nr:ferric reductase like transmembrane component-domain-containing protein [Truncatella angustata]KAH6660543.1 ferric reductase like transmembrane component-domain-containing protein [Truncatella angustata]
MTSGWLPSGTGGKDESREYLERLIYYILHGRVVASWFNYVILATIVVFSVIHWRQKFRDAQRRRILAKPTGNAPGVNICRSSKHRKLLSDDGSGDDIPSSSSSSTLVGKTDDTDVERQPLLGHRTATNPASRIYWSRLSRKLRAWLMYQPRPLPIVNRHLPANGITLFVLGYISVNIFLHLYDGSLLPKYAFPFADRAGYIFIVNLPLLYLLAAKNQPIKFLTGYSYEALNIFHRRVGEWMCFEAVVHSVGMVLDNIFFEVEWLRVGNFWDFFFHPLVLLGIGAFVSYELLFLTSLGSFRQRWYELFLASHVTLQIAALVFCYLHFWTARPYVLASLVIFVADRLVWRLVLKSATIQADLQILEDGKTFLLSADWNVPQVRRRWYQQLFGQSIVHGWRPMDHVFITVPSLGRTHALQAHPFTIASAAPGSGSQEQTTHAWLSLLIRAHDGFTGDLLRHARLNSTVTVRVDGPYGSADALEMLLASDTAVLVAGGSGIAVVFPMVWDLVHTHGHISKGRHIHLLWVIHSRSHRSWMPQERLDELSSAGVHVTIPEPTVEVGRPDVGGYVGELSCSALQADTEIGVVVSGPDALNRAARNACASAVGQGAKVNLRVEKFGW